MIYHVADAPPHGKEYTSLSDSHHEGCPCGIKLSEIGNEIKSKGI